MWCACISGVYAGTWVWHTRVHPLCRCRDTLWSSDNKPRRCYKQNLDRRYRTCHDSHRIRIPTRILKNTLMRFAERSTGVQMRCKGREIASLPAVCCGLDCHHALGAVHKHMPMLPNDIHKRKWPSSECHHQYCINNLAGNCIMLMTLIRKRFLHIYFLH